ncbi:MAG: beta-L-arabinofuranosidase domain-containing protein [Flavitalea sp.]
MAGSRVADNLLADLAAVDNVIVTKGNHRGMAASSVLEPLCLLYNAGGDKKYLDAAKKIVAEWETPAGPQLISKSSLNVAERFPKPTPSNWFGPLQGQKSYEMMSCYEGLLELYRITGEKQYLDAVEKTWQNIFDTEINIAGSGSAIECWFGGKAKQFNSIYKYQETCVTVTWIKLSQQLLRLTGEAKYADAIEIAYYNALLGAMSPDGKHWAQYTPLSGRRMEGEEHCSMGLNCCIASGPRGLFTLPSTIVMRSKSGAVINFFADGSYETKSPAGKKLLLTQKTSYPQNGRIGLSIDPIKRERFEIKIRIPDWCTTTKISINGNDTTINSKGYYSITREWSKGDKVELDFEMDVKLQSINNNPEYIAFTRGPIVFARDERLGQPQLAAVLKPFFTKEDKLSSTIISEQPQIDNAWITLSVKMTPESYPEGKEQPVDVKFIDYASAGNGTTPSYFVVWLAQLVNVRVDAR